MLERPRNLLITILLGNLFINVFATSTATAMMLRLFGEKGLGYAFLLMSALIMAFGEIFPKAIAMHWAERASTFAIFPLRIIYTVVTPVRVPLARFSDRVVDYLRRHLGHAKHYLTWDELLTALKISRREGGLGLFEYEVLRNVLEFRQKVVKEIMTPSIHVYSMPITTGRGELLDGMLRSGFSRMPIYDESPDDIAGVLHIKDLLDPDSVRNEEDLRRRLRAPFFIPESAPIEKLYRELQARKAHMAIVIDEYASFVGIATAEDILEELVGDIRDARDPKTQPFTRLDDDRIVVLGTMEIDDFNDEFGVNIEDPEHATIAGYVTGAVGKIPREGETFQVGDLRFHIISALPNRVRKMRVEKIGEEE